MTPLGGMWILSYSNGATIVVAFSGFVVKSALLDRLLNSRSIPRKVKIPLDQLLFEFVLELVDLVLQSVHFVLKLEFLLVYERHIHLCWAERKRTALVVWPLSGANSRRIQGESVWVTGFSVHRIRINTFGGVATCQIASHVQIVVLNDSGDQIAR